VSDENETHPFRRVGWKKFRLLPYPHGGEQMQQHIPPALEGQNT
jgi:hypothetical protein